PVPLPERPARGRGARNPAPGAGELPRPRLPWLGPGRSDDPCQRPQTLPAGNQHFTGHDQPLAGADVGAGRRLVVRGPVPHAPGRCCTRRARRRARRRRGVSTLAAPLDVRLMNLTATLLFAGCALLALAGGASWM